jgi:imidazolonepropionase-like amidohydrolase
MEKQITLKNFNLVDVIHEKIIPNASLIVLDERIKEVFFRKLNKNEQKGTVIDCKGQTLLPGLIDAHIHAGFIEANLAEQQRRNFPSMIIIKTIKVLEDTLRQGFTTARDAGGADPGFREAIKQGLIKGPRLFVAGAFLSQTGGHGDLRLPTELIDYPEYHAGFVTRICDGVDAVRRETREQIRQGVDHIKIMASGGAATPSDELDNSQYSLEELKAVVFEAESAGKYVMAHCYSKRSARLCAQAGIRSIEHGNLLDRESVKILRDANAYLVPTLSTYEMLYQKGKELGIPDYFQRKINYLREKSLEALDIAHQEGVKIASGSDLVGGGLQNYKGLELELKSRVLGAMGAIIATTKTNAELLRREKDLGSIEKGKYADVILVNGDPLKDISLIQNYKNNITLIMKGGKIYKNTVKINGNI